MRECSVVSGPSGSGLCISEICRNNRRGSYLLLSKMYCLSREHHFQRAVEAIFMLFVGSQLSITAACQSKPWKNSLASQLYQLGVATVCYKGIWARRRRRTNRTIGAIVMEHLQLTRDFSASKDKERKDLRDLLHVTLSLL